MSKDKLKQLIEELKSEIQIGMKENNISGFSIAIVDKKGILWSEGFGYTDESKTKKVNPDTLFMIGSLSKAYNVMGFLRAMQKGMIHLDDQLIKYYPEFSWNTRFDENEIKKITFRHLLTHYAGLPHFTPVKEKDEDNYVTFDEYIKKINNCWQKYPVGDRLSYSNAGVDLAAFVLQKISGMSYAKYLEKEVYLPLGMQNSIVEPTKALKTENHARGFTGERQSTIEETKVPCLGAGAQWSSVNDMAKFLMMHFNNGMVNDERFLKEELLQEMYTIPFAEKHELSKIGLGIGISKNKYGGELVLSFFGDGPGYFNLHHFFPKLGIGWLLQINQNDNVIQFLIKLANKVGPALVDYKLGKIPESITITEEINLPPKKPLEDEKLNRLMGKYISRMLDIEIKKQKNQLVFTMQGEEHSLDSHSNSQFSSEKIPLVEFDFDETGRPKTIKMYQHTGVVTTLDYDSGPKDSIGPNKKEWEKFGSIYREDYSGMSLYTTTFIKNGHLHLVTNLRNKIRKLVEFQEDIFFTADGESVFFKDDFILLPGSEWKKDDIAINKIKIMLSNDPKNEQVSKSSLEELSFIYEATNQTNNLNRLKVIIEETYQKT
ncbi:MAG: serine hydrolase domain-containing protein [Candidatus Heimdallarchaeota archaeon]